MSEGVGGNPGKSGQGAGAPSARKPLRRLGVEVQGRVDDYLLKVDYALTRVGASVAERRLVGVQLRTRIMESLGERAKPVGPDPTHVTLADVAAVLAELGSPESHLNDAQQKIAEAAAASGIGAAAVGTLQPARPVGPQKLSKLALAGAVWVLVTLAMIVMWTTQLGMTPDGPAKWAVPLQLLVVPLGFAGPVATTVLGLMAIGQITRSNGRLTGLSLALFDALLYPLLLLDFIVFWMCWEVSSSLVEQQAISAPLAKLITQALPTVACVLGDYFLAARAWMAVQEPESGRRR